MNFSLKIIISTLALGLLVLNNINYSFAGNILNCPTCNLERNLCKNCNKNPKNKKSSSPQIKSEKSNKIILKTKDAEDKCTEIGFKKGTEKYGECVLKLLDLK